MWKQQQQQQTDENKWSYFTKISFVFNTLSKTLFYIFRMKAMFIFNYKASLNIIIYHKQVIIFFFKVENFLLVPRDICWKPWERCDWQNYVCPDQLGFLLFFFLSRVDLQYCVSFQHTAKRISYACIHIYSFLDFFPYRPVQSIDECPGLYSKSLLLLIYIFLS